MTNFLILSGIILLVLGAFWLLLKSAAFLAENSATLLKVTIVASIVLLGAFAAVIWLPQTPKELKEAVNTLVQPILAKVPA